MASKFTPEVRGAVLERFAAGCTIYDTAHAVGVAEKTLKGWLTRGRREESGDYADFARRADEVRAEAKNRPEPMTEEEHRLVVSESARKGNTQAMKLYWEMLLDDRSADEEEPADPLDELDELAERRAARAA